jgi:hypothetical protein
MKCYQLLKMKIHTEKNEEEKTDSHTSLMFQILFHNIKLQFSYVLQINKHVDFFSSDFVCVWAFFT